MKIAILPGIRSFGMRLVKVGTQIENFYRLGVQQTSLFDAKGGSLVNGPESASSFESGFGYEDEFTELKTAAYYRAQIMAGDLENLKTESGALYDEIYSTLSERLSKGDIKTVFNFGVSYAHIDTKLADDFPEIQFIGLDRSQLTILYNQGAFENRPNVKFIASDIFDHLNAHSYPNGLFLHVRTLTLLPETFVTKLYQAVEQAEFVDIAGFEQCGVSYETGRPFEFASDDSRASVNFRGGMFIHNGAVPDNYLR